MLPAALLLATSLHAQTPPPAQPATPAQESATATVAAERAALAAERAAERAAQAAERASEASARMAAAAERLAAALERSPAATAAEAKPADGSAKVSTENMWTGTVGLGLIALTGNASTVTFNGLASAQRKTEKWIYSARAFGVYGRARPPDEDALAQVVALSAGLQLRGDRRLTESLSTFLLAGAETDHVKSVEVRGIGEAGVSSLRTDLAFRFVRETRFQYYPTRVDLPDLDLGGPRLGVDFRYGLSKDILFSEEAEVVPNILGDARVLFTSRTQLISKLTEDLSLATSFLVQYDSAPAAGKQSTDTALSVSLEVAF
jgi:putative salt-induced outer membrane protein YdiY